MSIVGTRPPLISETNLYEPHHKVTIIAIKWFPSHVINLLTLRLRKINCGKRLSTHGTLFVRGTGTITIGENVSCR